MQFSLTTGEKGLYQDAQFLAGVDSNAFAIAEFTRFCNRWLYKAAVAAWQASGDWEFDDTNQTNFPIATTTLVDNQPDYSIPTNALKIHRVEVKDSGGVWSVIEPLDETELPHLALDEFYKTKGFPKFYRVLKNSFWLYPAPDTTMVTASAGVKLYFLREVSEFTTTSTATEPGLPEPFHRICSLGPAYDFALAKSLPNAANLKAEVNELLDDLRVFMAGRHRDFKPRLRINFSRRRYR